MQTPTETIEQFATQAFTTSDPGVVNRLDNLVGGLGGERHRLVHQQMAPPGRSPDSEAGLDIGRYREGDGVDVGKHLVGVCIGLGAEALGQRCRTVDRAPPDPDQLSVRMCGQSRRMSLACPVSRPDKSKTHHEPSLSFLPCWSAMSPRNQAKLVFGVRCWVA